MSGAEQAPTRAALLALRDERLVVGEAYQFLDEKRLLLAAEILRQLQDYAQLQSELQALAQQAKQNLGAALRRHGLHGLSVYPASELHGTRLLNDKRNFMGVTLCVTRLHSDSVSTPEMAQICRPSAEAEACRQRFSELTLGSARLAGISGNLYRLIREYRLTERRARALENVIIPELEGQLRDTSVYLEEMDMEDVVRARRSARI